MSDDKKQREHVHTLIVSDMHIGSPLCKTQAIEALLDHFTCDQVVYNGDIFDSEDLRRVAKAKKDHILTWPYPVPRLRRSHHHVLTSMSSLSERSKVNVYLAGNHDEGLGEILAFFTGTALAREHRWEFQGRKYIAIHGDQFDQFTLKNKALSDFATDVYWWVQLILSNMGLGSFADRTCRLIKHTAKHTTGAFDRVAKGALGYAQYHKANYIICGHTHLAEYRRSSAGVYYYNDGCCTESPITCITIEESGIYLRSFDETGQVSKEVLPW